MFLFIIFTIIAYLLGSLNSAVIVSKVMGLDDPRTTGSKNPGATNMLRTGGPKVAGLVLLFDALKGFIPVVLAAASGVPGFFVGLVGLAAVVGHIYPIFFKFQGGKGVATALGVTLGLSFWLGIIGILVWIAVAYVSGFAAVASLSAAGAIVILSLLVGHFVYFIPLAIIGFLLFMRHGENLQRLSKKTEPKIDFNAYKEKIKNAMPSKRKSGGTEESHKKTKPKAKSADKSDKK